MYSRSRGHAGDSSPNEAMQQKSYCSGHIDYYVQYDVSYIDRQVGIWQRDGSSSSSSQPLQKDRHELCSD